MDVTPIRERTYVASNAAGPNTRSTIEQRREVREVCDYLRSDLYKRDGGTATSARWTSPLGWTVEYGYNRDQTTIWVAIYQPDGKLYAANDLATLYWLGETLP